MDAVGLPAWDPHLDVWVLGLGLLGAYWWAIRTLGPRYAPSGQPAVTTLQAACFVAGVLSLWIVADWPIHDVAEQRLFSVHMVQHLVELLVGPPLLLLGTPAWLARLVLGSPPVLATVRRLARFVPALVVFNLALVALHVPFAVEWQLGSGFVHFAFHAFAVTAALVAWMPVLSPLPEVPRLMPPLRMLFLFLQGVVPTVPASFLTFGDHPLYRVYEDLPGLWGLSTLDDMRIGGLIMKIGGGVVLWVIIAVIFFRWYAEEEMGHVPGRPGPDLDRELEEMGSTTP